MNRAIFDETVQAYLAGEQNPPNDTVAYLVDKYREARAEFEVTADTARKLEQQLTAAREHKLVLQGKVNSYAADLEHWMGLEEERHGGDKEPGPRTEQGIGGVQVTDKRAVA